MKSVVYCGREQELCCQETIGWPSLTESNECVHKVLDFLRELHSWISEVADLFVSKFESIARDGRFERPWYLRQVVLGKVYRSRQSALNVE